jgi:hypothetical protein
MLSKAMGWDQLKDDSIMMKGQGDTLMAQMRDMYGMGKGLLSGTGQFYDSAMKSFTRDTTDAMAQNARNITRNFAAKGAGGGFADMINANQTSSGRLGEARQGFFANLFSKGAQIGAGVMQGSQGFSGQAGQAYNRSTQLNEKRSDIATGLLNSTIGLVGGMGMQNLANRGAMDVAKTMMGQKVPAKASMLSRMGSKLGGVAKKIFGSETGLPVADLTEYNKIKSQASSVLSPITGGSGRLSLPGMKPTTYGPPKPSMTYQNIPASQRSNYNRFAPSVSSMLQSGMLGGAANAAGPLHMYDGYNQGVNTNNQWNEFADPYHPRNFQGDYYFGDIN